MAGQGGLWGEMIGGFGERAAENRAETQRLKEAQIARDQRIFETLAKSDDDEIAGAAMTGLLSMADGTYDPKGLSKFLGGAPGTNPQMTRIIQMLRTGGFAGFGPKTDVGETILGNAKTNEAQAATVMAHPGSAAMAPPPNKGGGVVNPPTPSMPVPDITPLVGAAPPVPQFEPGDAAEAAGDAVAELGPYQTPQVGTRPPEPFLGMRMPVQEEITADGQPGPAPPRTGMPAGGMGPASPEITPREMGAPAPPDPYIPQVPRRVFRTSEQRIMAETKAREQAEVEGLRAGLLAAGFSPEEVKELIKSEYLRRTTGAGTTGYQAIDGEVPDGRGGWTQTKARFERATGKYYALDGTELKEFRPRQTTGSTSFGSDRESIARAKYGRPFGQLTQEQQAAVNQEATRLLYDESYQRTHGGDMASAVRPLDPLEIVNTETALRANLERYIAGARVTMAQGQVIEEAGQQIAANLKEGLTIGAQSQALISAFAKMIDELSAVRTEEYNRTPENQSAFDQIEGWWMKVTQGGAGLATSEIANILKMAKGIFDRRERFIGQQALTTYRQATSTPGLRIQNILSPDVLQILQKYGQLPAAGAPQAGAPPSPAVATPPPVPQAAPTRGGPAVPSVGDVATPARGQMVGNVYTGEVRGTDARPMGLVDGQLVPLTKGPNGPDGQPQYFY